ncbi:acid-sensing ion channel 4-like [Brachionus plicatilis]|uniref:Acid-sensing ion channel 4-like n=1 Tax=Brachionus plicatilis TaxID=10195 RepID=A0A3M7Q344_BRAPC|nr:acid-sensing ion channel 4-like [Brachionus plicatilis]
MPKPYSECIENLEDIDSEYYRKVIRSNLTYRQLDCFDAYISDEIYKKCGCELLLSNLIVEKKPCNTYQKQLCGSDLFKEIIESNYKSKIRSLCPLECESVRYKISKSENKYPSESYAKELLETNMIKNLFSNRSNVSFEELSSNILAVNVYYEYPEQTEITQSAIIRWDGLVASIGGTLGLFLGIMFNFLNSLTEAYLRKKSKNFQISNFLYFNIYHTD